MIDCKNYGSITAIGHSEGRGAESDLSVGGIAGRLYKDISYCSNFGNISSTLYSYTASPSAGAYVINYVGGIVGNVYNENINACFNEGNIFASTEREVVEDWSGYYNSSTAFISALIVVEAVRLLVSDKIAPNSA